MSPMRKLVLTQDGTSVGWMEGILGVKPVKLRQQHVKAELGKCNAPSKKVLYHNRKV
jgi:hypothetical protein